MGEKVEEVRNGVYAVIKGMWMCKKRFIIGALKSGEYNEGGFTTYMTIMGQSGRRMMGSNNRSNK